MFLQNKLIFILSLLFGSCFFGFHVASEAQVAPVTTAGTVVNAIPGQQVIVPVTVTGFNNIGSITLHLNYDYSKLQFVQCNLNPLLISNFSVGDLNLGNGNHQIAFGWYTTTNASLTDGTWLLNFVFTYISGTSALQWNDIGPSCLYTDGGGNNLYDIPTSTYYINGMVCGAQGSPGSIAGSSSVCQGQMSVAYSITPMQNVIGYNWSVPPGASIASGNNTNSIMIDFSNTATSGNVAVNGVNECGNGTSSTFLVEVNNLPIAIAGNDTAIPYGTSAILHAANGGNGSFFYSWSPENLLVNPNVQNPQTVPLTSTIIFHLVVTTQGSPCTSNDNVTITISGGALSSNPVVVPGNICRTSFAELFANAGGGTGNYSYSWVCVPAGNPPWTSNLANPVVSPDSSRHYFLTVNDGFSTSSGSTNLIIDQLPTAAISGGDSLCEDGSSTIIRIDLTGIPPWSFIYSNGLTSTTINNQITSPYLIATSDPGIYSVLSINDENCYGTSYGAAPVMVFPIPTASIITQSGTILNSNASSGNQWYRNLVAIPGANDQSFTPTENGQYYDIVTLNGCSSDSSNNIDVIITNTEKLMCSVFQISPNPAKDYFFIKSSIPLEKDMKLTVFSNDGILIKECEVNPEMKSNEYLIDVRNLSPGLYFLMIYNGGKGVIQKLVIL